MTSPMPSAQCPVPSDRDLTLTEKAVAMLQLAEAGVLPKFQVVHHACSFDRCSCWCVYNPDKTLFAAIGPSERDRVVANKLVDKMNRDLAQIRARDGERQEAGGKGQEGETVTQTHTGGTPVPPETTPTHVSVGVAPAADSLRATNPGSAGVGGGTAAGAGEGLADFHRRELGEAVARFERGVFHTGGTPETVPAQAANPLALPPFSERVEPNLPSVIRALVPPMEEFFGDRSMAMAASGRSAVEVASLFARASIRGLGLYPVRIERPIAGQLLVILEGIDADGIERGHSLNVFSIPAVAKMVADWLVSDMQAAERAVGA